LGASILASQQFFVNEGTALFSRLLCLSRIGAEDENMKRMGKRGREYLEWE
jgi:hypothetical protein